MANTAANVSAGKPKVAGAVWYAPSGTSLPTNATTALASGFVGLGYLSEEGLTHNDAISTETIHAWGGDPVATLSTEHSDTFQFTLIETLSANVQKFLYGDSSVTLSGTSLLSVSSGDALPTERILVFEMILNGRAVRFVVPRAILTERGEITYVDNAVVSCQVTVTGLADSSGKTHYQYYGAAS